ncbi:DUF1559 family PulG-like putative transporter [Frigoriglobus tundricola]|uniref:DUF1559 domain-containing protein n=1 Tax=Frigoriglobus tundricola TaxID=2774151 RepID=A0A6M5YH54_9BACT|nr:DUF1559 domain-containing protein [Frigoriglobus tundricola]QJW92691.1 hypothetical protein FTUN_0188 [Frigoriglobus tundricola]
MRFALRAGGLAVVAALAATVLTFAPYTPTPVAAAQPGELPADLALVPADAAGFVHVRLADAWKNEVMDGFRKTWEKAGPKALAALDKQFVPAPSAISRGTAFVLLDDKLKPQAVGVLAFSAAFDPMTVVKTYLPNHTTEKVNGRTVYRSPDAEFEFYFPDDKHIVIGVDGSLNAYLAKPVAKTGPLAAALKLAGSGSKVLVASADLSGLPIPEEAFKDVPPEARAILKAKQLTLAVDLGADARFDIRATYADADAAQDAEKSVKAAAELGRKELAKMKKELEDKLYDPKVKSPRPGTELPEALGTVFALGAVARLDETLTDSKFITRDKTELAVAVPVPKEILNLIGGSAAMAAVALVPAAQKLRGSAAQIQSANNLKQIGLAIHNYHDATGSLPQDIVDKKGKPLLSWRVSLLPYLEQANLYNQFKLDEPWDSDNNKQWSQAMVKVFLSPEAKLPEKPEWGMTSYRGISGPGAVFEKGMRLTILNVTDGTSNTIGVIETDELVPWAKPSDYPFDPKKPLPKIVPVGGKATFLAAFVDGSVHSVKVSTPEKTLKALFTRAGGEVIDLDKYLVK